MTPYSFRLYVAGQTERTEAAVRDLRWLCESALPGRYELEIIDVVERPDLAESEGILIAPTVVRLMPLPQRWAFGDLSDRHRTAAALGFPVMEEAGSGGDRR
ncbi:circadian clock KaiB family protein [Actinopolymorpha sp. B17G11]|uniref:circadian clock KaiB family protein n=1 Tax=unclassified Actinopolymorpha TaxID=2627063 RepID=UPI0032D9AA5A